MKIIFLCTLLSYLSSTYMVLCMLPRTHILILGGNGLLGSATVEALIRQDQPYNITLLNRGNWYWDTQYSILPYIHHVQCNRGDGFREDCLSLVNDDTFYDFVIDFSAYDPLDIEDILIVLKGRFKRYIYISSDSVYEVCEFKLHDGFTKEEDALRPRDPTIRYHPASNYLFKVSKLMLEQRPDGRSSSVILLTLNRDEYSSWDNYGHKKYEGEETLARHHKKLNYDYIALRLPDVIGPRDNTNRFWKYYMWSKLHEIIGGVHVKKDLIDKPLRFVFSKDVGKLISKIVLKGTYGESIWNQAYNLGFQNAVTFKEFIGAIGKFINKGPIEFIEDDQATLNLGFPSVTRGATDISKAQRVLNWKPTDLTTALKQTCQFYENAEYNPSYKFMLDHVLDFLDVRGEKYRDFIEMHHGKSKDEL